MTPRQVELLYAALCRAASGETKQETAPQMSYAEACKVAGVKLPADFKQTL